MLLAASFDDDTLTVTYPETIAATDVEACIEQSFDLVTWNLAPVVRQILSDDGTIRFIRAGVPFSPGDDQFVRAEAQTVNKVRSNIKTN